MNFDKLDKEMRKYELSLDQIILPEIYMVARLDGRNFTRLTKEICKFEAPFDVKFRDLMVHTLKHLMDCGFKIIYGFTESDEISILFSQKEDTFSRKVRKYNSILSAEASAVFSMKLGKIAAFDCRVVPLPTIERVQDYFLWRQEDAHRNSLNSHCYWLLRKEGKNIQEATNALKGKSVSYKNELLYSKGINFDKLPAWQKRGVGVWKEEFEKNGYNPITQKEEKAIRNKIKIEYELPLGRNYAEFIRNLILKE